MANRQTRYLNSVGRGTRLMKGQQSPLDNNNGSYSVTIDRPRVTGVCVDSSNERKAAHRKPWLGNPRSCRKDGVLKPRFY